MKRQDDSLQPEAIDHVIEGGWLVEQDRQTSRLIQHLHTHSQEFVRENEQSLDHIWQRLMQSQEHPVALPTQWQRHKKNITMIKEKEVMLSNNTSQRIDTYPPLSHTRKRHSLLHIVGLGLVAAVALVTILSFTLFSSVLRPAAQTAANKSSTMAGAAGQQQQSQVISNGRQICSFTTSYAVINSLPWGPELDWSTQGQIAAAGYNSLQVASANNCRTVFSQPLQQNYETRWSPDGSKVVVVSAINTLDVLDRQGRSIAHWSFSQLGAYTIGNVFWSSDSTKLIFSSSANRNGSGESIKSINISGSRNITTLMTFPPESTPAFFSSNGKFFLVSHLDIAAKKKELTFWDFNNRRQISTLPELPGILALSPDSSQVAVAEKNQIAIYTTADGKLATSFSSSQMPTDKSTSLAWSPDGKYIAEGTSAITIYNVNTKKAVATFGQVDAQHGITTLAWAPDSQWLASATGPIDNSIPEATVHVWKLS